MKQILGKYRGLLCALAAVLAAYLGLSVALDLDLLAHSPYDSYTLQAMQWRAGRIDLPENYPWLEIACYEGRYYISFPPFPSVPMLMLSFVFGANTPSMLVSMACYLLSFFVGYALMRRHGCSDGQSALWAVFLVCGCCMMEFSLFGGVWNVAQCMGFALGMLAFYLCGGPGSAGRAWGLVAIACAVGCRPFYAVYVPYLMLLVWQKEARAGETWQRRLGRYALQLAAPALIALAYALYNVVRFDNPFEFGHNYLPEFIAAQDGQLSLAYVGKNLRNILRLPYFEGGLLRFPMDSGFAFYLCNGIYVLFALCLGHSAAKGRLLWADVPLLVGIGANFFLLLLHKSFGGVQFGCRYLCDLIPAMYYFIACHQTPRRQYAKSGWMVLCVIFCIYGAYLFQRTVYGGG